MAIVTPVRALRLIQANEYPWPIDTFEMVFGLRIVVRQIPNFVYFDCTRVELLLKYCREKIVKIVQLEFLSSFRDKLFEKSFFFHHHFYS